jgi:hypothetical protein
LPLTTTAPISDRASCGDGAWILLSATVPPASGVCDDGSAWASVSAAVPLATGDCRDDHAGAAPSAVAPADGTCEAAVTGAWIGAVDEFAASHAHNATPQTPAVANTPTVTAALRNPMGRRDEFCAARRGPDATAPGFMA